MDRPYDIGFAKPPKGSQFQKGQSGNPAGRPKNQPTKDISKITERILDEPITVKIGGEEKRITMREAIMRKIFLLALGGKQNSLEIALKLMSSHVDIEEFKAEVMDDEVLKSYLEGLRELEDGKDE